MEAFEQQAVAIILVSLRTGPVFVIAPPFTLFRVPVLVRVVLSLALATLLVLGSPNVAATAAAAPLAVGLRELVVGLSIALGLQLAFAAILTVGRAIDIQAGYGLALLADPNQQGQMPLVGTVLAYGAAMVFFLTGGPVEVLGIFKSSMTSMPPSGALVQLDVAALMLFISSVFAIAVGLVGLIFLSLFLIDLTIALMARTLPQMNVLLIGFQVKTLAVLITLPIAIGMSGAIYARLIRLALDAGPSIVFAGG